MYQLNDMNECFLFRPQVEKTFKRIFMTIGEMGMLTVLDNIKKLYLCEAVIALWLCNNVRDKL